MSAKLVRKEPIQFSIATLARLMDDCLPEQIENELDMQELINKLWPALICEHEHELEQYPVLKFLEENAPVYDSYQGIDQQYCCEITLLKERERLYQAANK